MIWNQPSFCTNRFEPNDSASRVPGGGEGPDIRNAPSLHVVGSGGSCQTQNQDCQIRCTHDVQSSLHPTLLMRLLNQSHCSLWSPVNSRQGDFPDHHGLSLHGRKLPEMQGMFPCKHNLAKPSTKYLRCLTIGFASKLFKLQS